MHTIDGIFWLPFVSLTIAIIPCVFIYFGYWLGKKK